MDCKLAYENGRNFGVGTVVMAPEDDRPEMVKNIEAIDPEYTQRFIDGHTIVNFVCSVEQIPEARTVLFAGESL